MEHILSKDCWCNPIVVKIATKKQFAILQLIDKFQEEHRHSPTLKYIADKFRVSQPSIHQQVQALVDKGYLEREKNAKRSFNLTEKYYGEKD
jgi:DNA-binding MarR family transcriptional regulator